MHWQEGLASRLPIHKAEPACRQQGRMTHPQFMTFPGIAFNLFVMRSPPSSFNCARRLATPASPRE